MRAALALVSLLTACRAPAPPRSAQEHVYEQASHDFGCPIESIAPGQCSVCEHVVPVCACGVEAMYGWSEREGGGYDIILMSAFSSRR
ncbi:MAG: hypothetical protein ACXVEF_17565 [Polyangiales bacterium]